MTQTYKPQITNNRVTFEKRNWINSGQKNVVPHTSDESVKAFLWVVGLFFGVGALIMLFH